MIIDQSRAGGVRQTFASAFSGLRFGSMESLASAQEPRIGTARSEWRYGASLTLDGAQLKLWAPNAGRVELVLLDPPRGGAGQPENPSSLEQRIRRRIEMTADGRGSFHAEQPDLKPGELYMYRLYDREGRVGPLLPDPRSRFQPEDVHGPSALVDLDRFQWTDQNWTSPQDKRQLRPTRVHIGTFTDKGTFEAAIKKLDYIKQTGYNAIEIMPVKEFPGRWNWGYDMVGFFATENSYGKPEQFQRLVDEAHKRGLAVVLDVVYNHVGPEGNYFEHFDKNFMGSPGQWGKQFNWQNPQALNFVLDNVESWVRDFHIDGFRFDMSSRMPDTALRAINEHLTRMQVSRGQPLVYTSAEDDRTSNHVTLPAPNGLGFWAKWNFDYHHRTKSVTTGIPHMNASTHPRDLSWLLEEGFPGPNNPMNSLHDSVNFYESHDEIGNHHAQRTNVITTRQRFIVGSLLKYLVPGVPLNFMGEEYGERNPFYFFVNYSDPDCIRGVRDGRRTAPQPDPMRADNFQESKLSWRRDEGLYRLNQAMLQLRTTLPALWQGDQREMQVDRSYLDSGVLVIRRRGRENPGDMVQTVINFSNHDYRNNYTMRFPSGEWQEVLNTDDRAFGGSGLTNAGRRVQGEQGINLPAWGISVFHKKAPHTA